MIGKRNRGIIFFVVVVALFALGIQLQGELFELDTGALLTLLAGLAEMGVGLPYFIIKMMGFGAGAVTSVTYEYGYTFCIVAGLLNMLIVLDVYDILVGRKD